MGRFVHLEFRASVFQGLLLAFVVIRESFPVPFLSTSARFRTDVALQIRPTRPASGRKESGYRQRRRCLGEAVPGCDLVNTHHVLAKRSSCNAQAPSLATGRISFELARPRVETMHRISGPELGQARYKRCHRSHGFLERSQKRSSRSRRQSEHGKAGSPPAPIPRCPRQAQQLSKTSQAHFSHPSYPPTSLLARASQWQSRYAPTLSTEASALLDVTLHRRSKRQVVY